MLSIHMYRKQLSAISDWHTNNLEYIYQEVDEYRGAK